MSDEIVSMELEELAVAIREEHQLCLQSMRKGLEHALKVGELLIQAKSLVKHGDWGKWVEQHCDFTSRMARNYMKVAVGLPLLKTETVSEMTLRDALERVNLQLRLQAGSSDEFMKRIERGVQAFDELEQSRKERKKRWKLEQEHNQVKEYLDAMKDFTQVVRDVVEVAEYDKFSPEGIRFTIRKHDALREELARLEEVFTKKLEGVT